jgi:hypothetical protein
MTSSTITAVKIMNGIMDQVDGDMEELQFLRNVLINGDQDVQSSNDILAICTRIAQLEKRLK